MKDWSDQEAVVLEIGRGELILIDNALDEVSNGIYTDEGGFQTRLGVSVEDARRLPRRVQDLLDS